MAEADAEEGKIDRYKDPVDGHLFQPLAFEIQGAPGPAQKFFRAHFLRT